MAKETKILQVKRGSTTDWASEVAPLKAGELGYDTTTKEMKCGDGTTAFSSLPALGAGEGGGGGTGDVESFSSSLMVSVGTGGDYATLNEALTALSKLHVSFPANYDPMSQGAVSVPTAIIMLMPGYVITEPVICNAINLSWIMVASMAQAMSGDVALVEVDTDAIRSAPRFYDSEGSGWRAVFLAVNGGVCPIVGFGFTMTGEGYTGGNGVDGLVAIYGGKIITNGMFAYSYENCQFANCEGSAIFAGFGGYVYASGWSIPGCQGYSAVNAYDNGRVSLSYASIENCSGVALRASYGGVIAVDGGIFGNIGGDYGAVAMAGGKIIFIDSTVQKGEEPSSDDMCVQMGGTIVANLSTGGTSQTPNTITADGIIFK